MESLLVVCDEDLIELHHNLIHDTFLLLSSPTNAVGGNESLIDGIIFNLIKTRC